MAKKKKKADETGFVREYLADSILAKVRLLEEQSGAIAKAGKMLTECLAKGGKWLIFGNGGSAGDSQHLATEMTGRFYKLERRGLPAIALTTDSSALTAIGNDYGFEAVFSRQVEALGKRGDLALGISTSGNSPNVLKGLEQAKRQGLKTLAFSGSGGGRLAKARYVDLCITVPSHRTFHIQECHITMGQLVCYLAERELLRRGFIKDRKRG